MFYWSSLSVWSEFRISHSNKITTFTRSEYAPYTPCIISLFNPILNTQYSLISDQGHMSYFKLPEKDRPRPRPTCGLHYILVSRSKWNCSVQFSVEDCYECCNYMKKMSRGFLPAVISCFLTSAGKRKTKCSLSTSTTLEVIQRHIRC